MADIAPPEAPGWYADAGGAWWWWDGQTWSAPPAQWRASGSTSTPQQQERTLALLMWICYLVLGGWLAALIFYLVAKEKAFVRHHAAEALNLALVLALPQLVGAGLIGFEYFRNVVEVMDDPDSSFQATGLLFLGFAITGVASLVHYGLGIAGAIKANQGAWWRLPIGIHPVPDALAKGAEPPYDVSS